ncbi:hypothetical protein B0H15DRAFT_943554 [Mycena belliarum]|uniref:Uncharacterized protein n=1 Tax=Mycena belliarum TaxID=1033014 RepID=A0AAD6XY72_9AGAR|nr:hypothetical protein B0H15DRAFT_943554 [Mycena belliae]
MIGALLSTHPPPPFLPLPPAPRALCAYPRLLFPAPPRLAPPRPPAAAAVAAAPARPARPVASPSLCLPLWPLPPASAAPLSAPPRLMPAPHLSATAPAGSQPRLPLHLASSPNVPAAQPLQLRLSAPSSFHTAAFSARRRCRRCRPPRAPRRFTTSLPTTRPPARPPPPPLPPLPRVPRALSLHHRSAYYAATRFRCAQRAILVPNLVTYVFL